jgi:XTP/dITP diphosphohydrolase
MKLHLASGNPHKLAEFRELAATAGTPVELAPAAFPAVAEDSGSFAGNARIKARAAAACLPPNAWVLADDSGICVAALGGAPGVESAYFAGPKGDPVANLAKLVSVMADVPEELRNASFTCCLLLQGPRSAEVMFAGTCSGRLLRHPSGGGGFGYDPLFVPDGFTQSFASLSDTIKNRISHRARAWARLHDWLVTNSLAGSVS